MKNTSTGAISLTYSRLAILSYEDFISVLKKEKKSYV